MHMRGRSGAAFSAMLHSKMQGKRVCAHDPSANAERTDHRSIEPYLSPMPLPMPDAFSLSLQPPRRHIAAADAITPLFRRYFRRQPLISSPFIDSAADTITPLRHACHYAFFFRH
jgi:hypothetical protein